MPFKVPQLVLSFALCAGLGGCVDYTTEIVVTSETTGSVVQTEFYEPGGLEKMSASQIQSIPQSDGSMHVYCENDWEKTLTRCADRSATCVRSTQGSFDQLTKTLAGGTFKEYAAAHPIFTLLEPGKVRVSLDPKYVIECIDKLEGYVEIPSEIDALLKLFQGHFFTIRMSGDAILDTNMPILADGKTAELVLSAYDAMTCKINEEKYAVVRVNTATE